MPDLEKNQTNPHHKYSYVSIDDFYRQVARVAFAHDLFWTMKEIKIEPLAGGSIAFSYSFTLMHATSGVSAQDFDRVTVVHPPQGAQTAGSARSYAEKVFMRSLFKVATGEPDADATDHRQTAMPQAPKPQPKPQDAPQMRPQDLPPPKPPAIPEDSFKNVAGAVQEIDGNVRTLREGLTVNDADLIMAAFKTFLPMCENHDEVLDTWKKNIAVLNLLKDSAPTAYQATVNLFAKTKSDLAKGNQHV